MFQNISKNICNESTNYFNNLISKLYDDALAPVAFTRDFGGETENFMGRQ